MNIIACCDTMDEPKKCFRSINSNMGQIPHSFYEHNLSNAFVTLICFTTIRLKVGQNLDAYV